MGASMVALIGYIMLIRVVILMFMKLLRVELCQTWFWLQASHMPYFM
jgi:hypothetical protein